MMPTIETPRPPGFENLLAILRREEASRPTLFEFIGDPAVMLGEPHVEGTLDERMFQLSRAFLETGYDFATLPPWLTGFLEFEKGDRHKGESVSQNEGGLIFDEASFEAYPWPRPQEQDYSKINDWGKFLPSGAKFLAIGPSGVLENLTDLVSFEELCYMIADEPELVQAIVDRVGQCLLTYYERMIEFEEIGAAVVNDDWGFKTQTMLSPADMRRFIFPWHQRIVAAIHAAGKPAILHSCGNMGQVWEDIIEEMNYDGKHSYEDIIMPPEQAYAELGDRIAVMGGLDMDFLCRERPEKIRERARGLLEQTGNVGYALGSGNSIARYVPREAFRAMTAVALAG